MLTQISQLKKLLLQHWFYLCYIYVVFTALKKSCLKKKNDKLLGSSALTVNLYILLSCSTLGSSRSIKFLVFMEPSLGFISNQLSEGSNEYLFKLKF